MFPAPPDEIKLRQDTPPDTTVEINDNGREITMDGRYLPTMATGTTRAGTEAFYI